MARKKPQISYPESLSYKSKKFGLVRYTLIFTDLVGCYGICDPNTREIRIQKGMSARKTLETVIHEVLHLIEFEEEMTGFTHRHIGKLDAGLAKILMENFF